MPVREFAKWQQKVLLGASVRVVAPTGQYDSNRLVNWSLNRWAFKPEFGYSQRFGHWVLDGYAGIWLYTRNPQAYSGTGPVPQTMKPIGSFEGHLSYDLGKLGTWVSLDGNYWCGGVTTLNGIENSDTRQSSSRLGGSGALPITRHQAIKLSYSVSTFSRFGGLYQDGFHWLAVWWINKRS